MSFHSNAAFRDLATGLTKEVLATAAAYAASHALQPLDPSKLSQMTDPLESTMGQVLMFGCNAWPDDAREDDALPSSTESTPSETDPPLRLRFAAMAVLVVMLTLPMFFAT